MKAYEELANDIAVGLLADANVARKDIKKIIDLEMDVAKVPHILYINYCQICLSNYLPDELG